MKNHFHILSFIQKNYGGNAGFIIPREDRFQGEYVSPSDEHLAFASGFTGSAGLAILGPSKGALFTDGRYTLQAKDQVDLSYFEVRDFNQTSILEFLKASKKGTPSLDVLVFDPWLITYGGFTSLSQKAEEAGISLIEDSFETLNNTWDERPKASGASIFEHPFEFAGQTREEKLAFVRQFLKDQNLAGYLFCNPESIAWLLNIRGNFVPHTPSVQGFLMVTLSDLTLFTQVPFENDFMMVEPEEKILSVLPSFKGALGFDKNQIPFILHKAIPPDMVWNINDPLILPKSKKNKIEQEGARNAHVRDGLALVECLAWIDSIENKSSVTELDVVAYLAGCRQKQPLFVEDSFNTIAGVGSNGAIIHYRPNLAQNKKLSEGPLLLLDSGGQYRDGTTDVTRTLTLAEPTPLQKEHFTRVLKGHVALARAIFPKGTFGHQLDVLARQFLWQGGEDYAHGTGHGVGSFLSVHEGPQRISKFPGSAALEEGMILSNEPGIYKEGAYGIRIENLILVVPHPEMPDYLCFETLTLVPYDRRLILRDWLDSGEREWLDAYHKKVCLTLNPISKNQQFQEWLEKNTEPL